MQQEVRLSKPINSFEADFANGYCFGEILCQYGIFDNISQFSKKNNKDAKISNFYKIEQALRDMKVKFDAKLINNIMNEERGAALRLLYQIKRVISARGPTSDLVDQVADSGLKKSLIDKVR
jgi:6-pyruvoyl-tetrahydropterin synthase